MGKQAIKRSLTGLFYPSKSSLIGATLYGDALIYLSGTAETLGYGKLVDVLLKRKDIRGKIPNLRKLNNWLSIADKALKGKYTEIWDAVVGDTVELRRRPITASIGLATSISTAEVTVDDLLYWATNTVMGAAKKARNGEGEFRPG